MNKIKFIYILIILSLITVNTKLFSDESVYIVYKVNNQIITNKDVEKERQYLISLNNRLKELDESRMIEVSKESALREKIKEIELEKYFNFETLELNVDIYLENFYKTLNINNKSEFEQYLKKNNLSLDYIKNKIQIEVLWNQLIYDQYISRINIDKNKLKKKLQETDNNLDQKVYSLSEILFENKFTTNFDKKLKDITQSISEVGFNNAANLYSVSDSAKFGGKIGWVEEKKLSKKIIEELRTLDAGQYTNPLQTGGLFLILKIEAIKYEKATINEEEELDKIVKFETSKQLDQFAKIFYKKIKINNTIDEL